MAQQRSHVPKFGSWDGENVPYTAYFENARKDKVGAIRINPNDPEQNPEAEAFNIGGSASYGVCNTPVSISPDNEVAARRQRSTYNDDQKHKHNGSRRNLSSGSSSNGSSVNQLIKPKHHHNKSDSLNNAHDFSYRSVSVPKFGTWDENDPRSAEGFTVIFNKVKEEKQIVAAMFPPVPQQTSNNYQAREEKETRKKCCCLF